MIGLVTGSVEILSQFIRFLLIKLSVAPESTSTCLSAVACADSNKTGIRMDWYLLWYTLIFIALAQAAGFKHWKNPASQTIGLQELL